MTPRRQELGRLVGLALPVMGTQVGTMLMGLVDIMMVGRVGVDALAAASLGSTWVFATLLFCSGILYGVDPIVTQAHGAGDGAATARALQRSVVIALLLTPPTALLWLLTGPFLRLAGQDPALAQAAHGYVVVQIPSIAFFLVFTTLRQYLQGRALMRPAMWTVFAANLLNVFLNWALIFGHLGLPALGLVGAGIATALTRVAMFGGLLALVWGFSLHAGAWVPWSRAALAPRELGRILALGVPIALQVSLEIWAFSTATLLAGWLGADALAAHTIVLNMAALAFMMPLGISQGTITRVGNLLGRRDARGAQYAASTALVLGGVVMTVSATIFVLFRQHLGALFTPDPGVIALCASILPIAATFQIFDGIQVVGCGVLRAMGRTRPAAWFNLLAYWILGLPLAAWLALHLGVGLAGIWWGLCLGLAVVAVLVVTWVRVRGPASLAGELSSAAVGAARGA